MPTDRMINSEGYIVISHSPKARTVPAFKGIECGRCGKRFPLSRLAWFSPCDEIPCPIRTWRNERRADMRND